MIDEERDGTMIVTMTAGQLYELMYRAAERAAKDAVSDVLCRISASGNNQDSDILVGGEAIASALGVNRTTLYKLIRSGKLGKSVRHVGQKLIAVRSELLDAVAENQ